MFPKYFQQELSNLRELGAQFSAAHPALAPMLSGPQADPDVERLLEGTAFLTGLLRQKLDDEFPQIVQDLMGIVAPQYLKPLPSATIQVFKPKSTVKHSMKLPAGIVCASLPIEGVSCSFRTCYPLEIHPLTITDAAFMQRPGQAPAIKINFELNGLSLTQWRPESVRLFLNGDFAKASDLYLLLRHHLRAIRLTAPDGSAACVLERACLKPVGFALNERLVPAPSQAFPGFGVLQDYFVLPQKFLFMDLVGWERWVSRGSGMRFEVQFELENLPFTPTAISKENFVLHATPAVNLFSHEADPVYLDHHKTHYMVRPAGSVAEHGQIFSVDEIKGFAQGTCEERTHHAFDLFHQDGGKEPVFHLSHAPSPISGNLDLHLAVAYPAAAEVPVPETLSIKLTCTNGTLPGRLRAGDITVHGKGCPEYLTFANILPPSPGRPAPVGKNLLWRLLSHLSVGFQSMERLEVLRTMLDLYVFPEARDPESVANRKRIAGIGDIQARSGDRLVSGMVMRGREITLTLQDDNFSSSGDAYLFGSVLDTFFGNYASINSFTSLRMKNIHGGNSYLWPPRMGNRPLIKKPNSSLKGTGLVSSRPASYSIYSMGEATASVQSYRFAFRSPTFPRSKNGRIEETSS